MKLVFSLILFASFFPSFSQTPYNQGLAISLPFSGNTLDQSGNQNHGVIYGAQLTTDRFGNPNNAYQFDGVDDYIKVFHDSTLNFGVNDDYTISCWIKPDSIQNPNFQSGDIISKWVDNPGAGTNDGYPYVLRYFSQTNPNHGKVFFGRYDRPCQNFPVSNSTNTFLSEQFIHVVTLKRDSVLELYINGTLENSIIDNSSCNTENNNDFFIGRRGGSTNASFFKGVIDDINIYSRALDSMEILGLQQSTNPVSNNCSSSISSSNLEICFPFSGNAFDQSGKGNHGAVFGAQLTSDRFGQPNSAYEFDGVDDYIEIQTVSDLDSVGDFTISVWFFLDQWQPQSGGSNQDKQYVFDAHSYSSTTPNNFLTDGPLIAPTLDYQNNGYIRNSLFLNASNNYPFDFAMNDTNLLNSWVHNVYVREGDSTFHYYNGVLVGKRSVSQNLIDIKHNMFIGTFSGNNPNYGGKNFNFDGKIDDLFLFSRAIDSAEVISLFNQTPCQTKYDSTSITICPSDSTLTPKGFFTSSPGFYFDTLSAADGCDSIITLHVIQNAPPITIINPIECESYSYPSGKGILTTSGTYFDTLLTSINCDSIIEIHLSIVQDSIPYLENIYLCAGSTYQMQNGFIISSPGTYYDSLTNVYGCDSVVELNVYSRPDYFDREVISLCGNESYQTPGGQVVTSTGTYVDSLSTVFGCDSIIESVVTVYPDPTPVLNYSDTTICAGDFLTLKASGGSHYKWSTGSSLDSIKISAANYYEVTVTNEFLCDSAIGMNLTLTTDPSLCGNVGIVEELNQAQINLYPNPASNQVMLSTIGYKGELQIEVTDLKGATYLQTNFITAEEDMKTLDVSSLARGVYLVKIHDESTVVIKSLVIR